DELVAAGGADHRQGHAGVAAGGLDYRVAGLEQPALLGVEDDGQGEPVLDRPAGIERLDLGVELDALGGEPVQAHDRGAAGGVRVAAVDLGGAPCRFAVGGQTATALRQPVTTPREQRVVRDGTAALPDRASLCFRQPLAYAPVTRGHLDCTVRLPFRRVR